MRSSTWFRRSFSAAVAAGLLVTLSACGDDGGDDADDTGSADPEYDDRVDGEGDGGGSSGGDAITISGFAFEGATVAPGATVAVSNEDSTTHTVTADAGTFDISVPGGEEDSIEAPSEPGSYTYRCAIHSSMQGTLVVE